MLLVVGLLALLGAGSWWWFAFGPGAYTRVPDVTGLSAEAALAEIEDAGLRADVTEAHDDLVPEGLVVSTSPGPGEPVLKDGEVGVVVSLGILMLEVPETAGVAEAEALTTLEDAGLVVGTVSRPYDMTVPLGVVISTSPGAGEVIPHNSPVDVVVSNGREPVTIPSVAGAPQADAEQTLTDAGLVPELVTEYSDDVPAGQVIGQDPAPGPALRGDTVRLTVSLGPPLVPVPAVVGKQVDDATRILEDAGFVVRIERVLGGFFGTVRASDPTAGTAIARGSTVTLTIV